jgi:hypothetical protein
MGHGPGFDITTMGHGPGPVTKTLFFSIISTEVDPGRDETGGRRGHRRRAAARQRRWRGRVSGSDEDGRNDGKICRGGQAVSWPADGSESSTTEEVEENGDED